MNTIIKEPLKEKEEITYFIKEPLVDPNEVSDGKAQKEKKSRNTNEVDSKRKTNKRTAKEKGRK